MDKIIKINKQPQILYDIIYGYSPAPIVTIIQIQSKGTTLFQKIEGSLTQDLSKWKLVYEAKAEIDLLIAKVNKIYYSIHASFLLAELVLLSSILLLHKNNTLVSLLTSFLILAFFTQIAFTLFIKSILVQEHVMQLFAVTFYVLKKGILNITPEIIKVNKWYGRRARKIFASKKFTDGEVETFQTLSKDWNGSYGDLLEATRSL